jgi:hypothetical protein
MTNVESVVGWDDWDPTDYVDYENERLDELAFEEIQEAVGQVSPAVAMRAAEWLIESYGVEGEPDIDKDEDGNVIYSTGGLSEFFRRDPRQAVAMARKDLARDVIARTRRPMVVSRYAMRSRGPSRAPRRVVRVSRRRATARAPGPDDPHEPDLANSRRLYLGAAT